MSKILFLAVPFFFFPKKKKRRKTSVVMRCLYCEGEGEFAVFVLGI